MKKKHFNVPAIALAVLSASPAWAQQTPNMATMPGMSDAMPMTDHGERMKPGAMPGMRHGGMNGEARGEGQSPQGSSSASGDMKGMDNGGPAMGQGAMAMGPMQGGSPPPDARDPNAYSDGYGFGPIAPPRMGDQRVLGSLLVDRLERQYARGDSATVYDLQGWIGGDYNRAVLKAEGDVAKGRMQDTRTELLWSHAVATFWDTQLGVRYDSGAGPGRGWLAFGFQGISPYWFNIEATGYLGDAGRSALRLAASYDLLFTQRLILQPRIEGNLYGKSDPEREVGSGLSDVTAGLRLRYEIKRELAPYIGIEWNGKFGQTADLARTAGMRTSGIKLVAGVRFWF